MNRGLGVVVCVLSALLLSGVLRAGRWKGYAAGVCCDEPDGCHE